MPKSEWRRGRYYARGLRKFTAPAAGLSWLGESFEATMLDDVFLVIAATDDATLNAQVSQCAEQRHFLANVVDDQPYCSFIFPSIIDRAPIVVAISSGGTARVLARIQREKLESMLPTFLGPMVAMAGAWHGRVKQRIRSMTGPPPVLEESAQWPLRQSGGAGTAETCRTGAGAGP